MRQVARAYPDAWACWSSSHMVERAMVFKRSSLTFSSSSAIIGILVKQWLNESEAGLVAKTSNARQMGRLRQSRFKSLRTCGRYRRGSPRPPGDRPRAILGGSPPAVVDTPLRRSCFGLRPRRYPRSVRLHYGAAPRVHSGLPHLSPPTHVLNGILRRRDPVVQPVQTTSMVARKRTAALCSQESAGLSDNRCKTYVGILRERLGSEPSSSLSCVRWCTTERSLSSWRTTGPSLTRTQRSQCLSRDWISARTAIEVGARLSELGIRQPGLHDDDTNLPPDHMERRAACLMTALDERAIKGDPDADSRGMEPLLDIISASPIATPDMRQDYFTVDLTSVVGAGERDPT
ncbi:hypothetical protein C8Q80DRAFT_170033 [Daedaleopsis nitida]|nr:hypothetical protein C8Q80DRAFT_170033 [Daedaleopsis nitida]